MVVPWAGKEGAMMALTASRQAQASVRHWSPTPLSLRLWASTTRGRDESVLLKTWGQRNWHAVTPYTQPTNTAGGGGRGGHGGN